MKLSIIVPHYEEPLETITPLFNSIALQQGVNLEDVEVIVVQDGSEKGLEVLNCLVERNYRFALSILPNKHQGVSASRNLGLEMAKGDYVMFCDCDDMFLNNYGLHLLFSAMEEQPNAIASCFVEEQKDEEGNFKIIRHDKDITFVHGKAYKRSFLNEQYIRFDENLTIHEDGFFNSIAITCAENVKVIETPFYLWKWNDNSTVRKNPTDFLLKTYGHLMKCRIAICKELETRGYINEFIDAVVKTVMDSYYDFNKPSFLVKENAELRMAAEYAFKDFFMKFKREFFDCAVARKAEIAFVSRSNAYIHGLVIETVTLADWLKHIQEL